jgi:hypothetical protein
MMKAESMDPEVRDALQELLSADDYSPAVARRVRALVRDMEANDTELMMNSLAELSHAVMGCDSESPLTTRVDAPGSVTISDDDSGALVGICYGPDSGGRCPWAAEDGKLPCNGLRLTTRGWQFKVAEEASEFCPLAIVLRDGA